MTDVVTKSRSLHFSIFPSLVSRLSNDVSFRSSRVVERLSLTFIPPPSDSKLS